MDKPQSERRKIGKITLVYGRSVPLPPGGRPSTASIQRAIEAKAARRRRWLIGAAISAGILVVLSIGVLIGRFVLP
jgi:hypothetical protein